MTLSVSEQITAASRRAWRCALPSYLLFVLAFPLAMLWVTTRPSHGPTICIFRQVTHLDCPGCGMTRAFRAMGKLDVPGAFRYNPLGPAIFFTTVICWGYATAMVLCGGRVRLPAWWIHWRFRLLAWGIALYLLVGVGRIVYEIHHPPPPPQAIQLQHGWPFF